MPFLTCAAAIAKMCASGLLPAPFMYLELQRTQITIVPYPQATGIDLIVETLEHIFIIYLGWANRLHVAHSNLTPVFFCSSCARSTISSKFLLVSSKVDPSGAMSLKSIIETISFAGYRNAAFAIRHNGNAVKFIFHLGRFRNRM